VYVNIILYQLKKLVVNALISINELALRRVDSLIPIGAWVLSCSVKMHGLHMNFLFMNYVNK